MRQAGWSAALGVFSFSSNHIGAGALLVWVAIPVGIPDCGLLRSKNTVDRWRSGVANFSRNEESKAESGYSTSYAG